MEGFQFRDHTRGGSAFPGAIADTAPDGWGRRVILLQHAKRRRSTRTLAATTRPSPLSELDCLLAVDDESRIGALRFKDEQGRFQGTALDGDRRAPPLIELAHLIAATRAVENRSETDVDLEYLRGRGTSLGGLRPKCSVRDDDGALSIGKFPSVGDERAVTRGEVLALSLAASAGINASAARLVHGDGVPVALIRRFDRLPGGQRLMYISAATLLGAGEDDGRNHAYTEIVDGLRRHGAHAQADIEELRAGEGGLLIPSNPRKRCQNSTRKRSTCELLHS